MRAAHRALRIFPELELAEAHLQRVVDQEAADQRLADAENQLDRFSRLDHADDARQHAKHSALRAARDQSWRRWLRVEASIAGAFLRREDRRLSFEPEDAAVR